MTRAAPRSIGAPPSRAASIPSPTSSTIVTAGQWTRFEADVQSAEQWVDGFGMVMTNPGVLTDVYVGGSGWDFTGAIDNLFLTGTNCPRNLP